MDSSIIPQQTPNPYIIYIYLVAGFNDLEKYESSSSMGFGWHPIYGTYKSHVWNQQPAIDSPLFRRIPPLGKWTKIHRLTEAMSWKISAWCFQWIEVFTGKSSPETIDFPLRSWGFPVSIFPSTNPLMVEPPLWKIMERKSVGMMTFPIWWEKKGNLKAMFQSTNQIWFALATELQTISQQEQYPEKGWKWILRRANST